MLRQADLALYAAKGAGKGRWRLYEPGLHLAAVDRLEVRTELERAIASGAFALHYQPIVELRSGAMVGVEALVRWHHPRRGLVPPADFIHVAEETGLVVPLGSWVLDRALADLAHWRADEGARDGRDYERQRLRAADPRPGLLRRAGRGARAVGRPGGVARAGDHGDGAARRRRAASPPTWPRCARSVSASRSTTSAPATPRSTTSGSTPSTSSRSTGRSSRGSSARAARPRSSGRSCTSPRRSACGSSPRAWRPPHSGTCCYGRAAVSGRVTCSRFRFPQTRSFRGCSPSHPRAPPA